MNNRITCLSKNMLNIIIDILLYIYYNIIFLFVFFYYIVYCNLLLRIILVSFKSFSILIF